VRNVEALTGTLDPLPDALGSGPGVELHGDDSRGIEDDQVPLTEVARVISVSQATDSYVRRLVQLDRFSTA
jgi:hypothetical protein